jgi:predicted nucleic acid-binding protein
VLLAGLKAKNRTLSCEDTLIAATALHHGCQVVTLNQRHFLPTGVQVLTPV